MVADLPTTHHLIQANNSITSSILELINLLATMARLDNEKRIERIKQGLERSGYKPTGKNPNQAKHKQIQELLAAGNMTKDEIAKAVGCGVATVYRVAKGVQQSILKSVFKGAISCAILLFESKTRMNLKVSIKL